MVCSKLWHSNKHMDGSACYSGRIMLGLAISALFVSHVKRKKNLRIYDSIPIWGLERELPKTQIKTTGGTSR